MRLRSYINRSMSIIDHIIIQLLSHIFDKNVKNRPTNRYQYIHTSQRDINAMPKKKQSLLEANTIRNRQIFINCR